MRYKDYKGYTKAYVVVSVTGTGSQGDSFVTNGVVFETDNKKEADSIAKKLEIENNTPAELKSTWYNNRYHVNINTLSDKGLCLSKGFEKYFDTLWEQAKAKL